MLKYAKIINDLTKQCDVGTSNDTQYYQSIGMVQMDVEQAYDGNWYLNGYAPVQPESTYAEKRLSEYPPIGEQLDMIYWDKINYTNFWQDTISTIKNKYPKE